MLVNNINKVNNSKKGFVTPQTFYCAGLEPLVNNVNNLKYSSIYTKIRGYKYNIYPICPL